MPFAQEISYQGLLPQQTLINIEGMQILPACVDNMDPVPTFIEPLALENTFSPGWGTRGVTPTLSAHLFSPEGPREGRAFLLWSSNYHKWIAGIRERRKVGKLRYATSLHFREVGSLRVGMIASHQAHSPWPRDTLLRLPSGRKLNTYTALTYSLSSAHTLTAGYLGDFFYNIAYPPLVMDAQHSTMQLSYLQHKWKDISELRLYGSIVFHDMTDQKRPLSEILTREIMPGMYMPMRGLTRTGGGYWNLRWWKSTTTALYQRIEYLRSYATASMDMLPVNGETPMRLLNLAQIAGSQLGYHLAFHYEANRWVLRSEASIERLHYKVRDTLEYLPLALYQQAYGEGSAEQSTLPVYRLALEVKRTGPTHTLQASIRYGLRPPTHHELFGYYYYVPMYNGILMGNAKLRPEQMLRSEVRWTAHYATLHVEGQTFLNWIRDYIMPQTFLQPFSPGNHTPQAWRILRNHGTALTTGATLSLEWQVFSRTFLYGYAALMYGEHINLREPLPWMPPMHAQITASQDIGTLRPLRLAAQVEYNAAQQRLSRTIFSEDFTPSLLLVHVRFSYPLFPLGEQMRLLLRAQVNNLLNTYGWSPLSVRNMPVLGREFRIGLEGVW
ncbi:MAG: TonB-dependent receptor [Bacteroidia bacterium]|nr:TonB-dependent receptor [Bacteroidia bacterium]